MTRENEQLMKAKIGEKYKASTYRKSKEIIMVQLNEVQINGVDYIRKDSCASASNKDGLDYVIVRTYSAGVFAGYLKSRKGKEGIMLNSRRLWSWSGAASLSQLAVDGVSNPGSCKFPCEIQGEHTLTEIIEVIPCTDKAKKSIAEVTIWKQ